MPPAPKKRLNPVSKLVQVTDCHLLADASVKFKQVPPKYSLQQVCSHIQQKHADADVLLLTGDLSQDGSEASYHHLLEMVLPIDLDTYALAGNHDDPEAMQAVFDKKIYLDKSLSLNNWRVLLLESTVASEVHGHLRNDELIWLERQIKAAAEEYFLLALHHQPVPTGSRWLDDIGLENASELWDMSKAYPNIRLLIHGHTHQANYYQINRIACYGGPSSWRWFAANTDSHQMAHLPPAYRVIELFEDGTHASWIEFAVLDNQ